MNPPFVSPPWGSVAENRSGGRAVGAADPQADTRRRGDDMVEGNSSTRARTGVRTGAGPKLTHLESRWGALLFAWEAWDQAPADRTAAVRLSEAEAGVADDLGVPAFRVSTVLAAGRRLGWSHRRVVTELANGWRP